LRGAARRLFALCLAAVVLVGTLTAGRTYLWCAMMEQRVAASCCAAERPDIERPNVERPDDARPHLGNGCCERHGQDGLTVAPVPSGDADILPSVAATVVPAPVPTVAVRILPYPPVVPARPSHARPIRAGPGTASAACARLQVFRC
jgi:hypothetical protein